MVWTPEPTYEKPDISVRATTLYYQLAAPLMLPFIAGRLLNLFRCREGKCFFATASTHRPERSSIIWCNCIPSSRRTDGPSSTSI